MHVFVFKTRFVLFMQKVGFKGFRLLIFVTLQCNKHPGAKFPDTFGAKGDILENIMLIFMALNYTKLVTEIEQKNTNIQIS